MEIVTILLSSLFSLISPAGVVVDRVAESTIRSRLAGVEQLKVRVDNAPSYQLVQGKVDRIRIAGRGLFPVKEVRLDTLELETDPVNLRLGKSSKRGLPLQQPLRAGVRLVLKQADLNLALQSPSVTKELQQLGLRTLDEASARQVARYEILNPEIQFLPNQRVRLQAELRETDDPATLTIVAESGVEIVAGRQLRLLNPVVQLNNEVVPERIVTALANGIFERSNLQRLEQSGITARVLQLQIKPDQIEVATFVQVAPDAKLKL